MRDAVLALTALAYARVRRMLRPLDDIRAGALRFGQGDFAQPIPVRHPARPDELGELAATINTMGGDIHQMLEAKRALLLAISHELRSPLTRARLNTELLPETPEVQPSRDALLRDLAQMRDLITDLLESERLASPHAALQREPVDLCALVAEVVASLEGAPEVRQSMAADLPVLALDRTRIRLLLRNLLDNAIKYTPEGGTVNVSVRAGATGMLLTVVLNRTTATQMIQLYAHEADSRPFFKVGVLKETDAAAWRDRLQAAFGGEKEREFDARIAGV